MVLNVWLVADRFLWRRRVGESGVEPGAERTEVAFRGSSAEIRGALAVGERRDSTSSPSNWMERLDGAIAEGVSGVLWVVGAANFTVRARMVNGGKS
jgi:hypothetical protein